MRFTFLVTLLLPAAAPAQDAVTIAIKEAGKGTVRECDVQQSTTNATRIVTDNGQVLHEKSARSSQHHVYVETVLEAEPGKRHPARLRRAYDKAVSWADKTSEVLPYQGKTVLVEKKDGKYRFAVEGEGGGELEGGAALALEREFNKDDDLDLQRIILPRGAVRPGDSWQVDMAAVARAWQRSTAMRVDAARSSGTGRLTKVYRKDGRQFGAMTFRLEMPIAALGAGQQQVKLDDGARVVMDVNLDCCVDGGAASGTMKASFWVDGTGPVPTGPGPPARLTFSTRGTLQRSHTEVPR